MEEEKETFPGSTSTSTPSSSPVLKKSSLFEGLVEKEHEKVLITPKLSNTTTTRQTRMVTRVQPPLLAGDNESPVLSSSHRPRQGGSAGGTLSSPATTPVTDKLLGLLDPPNPDHVQQQAPPSPQNLYNNSNNNSLFYASSSPLKASTFVPPPSPPQRKATQLVSPLKSSNFAAPPSPPKRQATAASPLPSSLPSPLVASSFVAPPSPPRRQATAAASTSDVANNSHSHSAQATAPTATTSNSWLGGWFSGMVPSVGSLEESSSEEEDDKEEGEGDDSVEVKKGQKQRQPQKVDQGASSSSHAEEGTQEEEEEQAPHPHETTVVPSPSLARAEAESKQKQQEQPMKQHPKASQTSISNTPTSKVSIKYGVEKEEAMKDGAETEETMKDGAETEETMKDGAEKETTMKDGAEKEKTSEPQESGDTTKDAPSSPPRPSAPPPKVMNEADKRALDDAFRHPDHPHHRASAATSTPSATTTSTTTSSVTSATPQRSRSRGMGTVHEETSIPNADIALRLIRKFAYKTQHKICTTYGGLKPRGIMSYLFTQKEDPTFVPYRELMEIIFDPDEDREDPYGYAHSEEGLDGSGHENSDRIVDAVLGVSSADTMARAKLAVASFVYLVSMWGHASSTLLDERARKSQEAFSELLSVSLDTATQLVAHGCLDGVLIGLGGGGGRASNNVASVPSAEYYRAVHMLAQSVFNADLTLERNELSALKFLLTTGCRITPRGDALLRGSHLLQTIRTLYHVYLTTESRPNKTTARAALQQLVTSVFTRLVHADPLLDDEDDSKSSLPQQPNNKLDNFPSENHRDAFLVLRSICKLSMRSLPDSRGGRYSHVGLQTSGSSDTWDGGKSTMVTGGTPKGGAGGVGDASDHSESNHNVSVNIIGHSLSTDSHEPAQLIYTAAIHPALESKLLALELLLYVLQRTDFSKDFIQSCGHQFHSAIRNYLCVSLLKNCTSDDTRVVNLSLRIFVPLVRSFRTVLKNEIEAFVTNVFFVILDSTNTPAEHKCLVVKTFDEICSDPSTLAEIFLNYDCDLSAVDLFHRIVNTLSKVSRTGLQEPRSSGIGFMGGASAARMEKFRNESRELRLDAMRALRQVLASLHGSIVEPLVSDTTKTSNNLQLPSLNHEVDTGNGNSIELSTSPSRDSVDSKQNLVEIYDSKKRRRAEESEAILRFNQKPSAGIAYATKCKHIEGDDPADVARYLLLHKDDFEKTQIGEYLGREPEYQNGFSLKVLHEYVRCMDFTELLFDEAIRYFLSGFRLPGEAQKIDRIMEKFAERYTEQNRDVFPTADAAFILSFSIIMLNTDLHNPAIKEERRMTKEGFIRNNRGICDGQDLPEELLSSIFDRIKANPISLKEDDEARERIGTAKVGAAAGLPTALNPASFFSSHYDEMDRARETNFQKERDHIVRTTESLLKRRRHSSDPLGKLQVKAKTGKSPKPVSKFVMTEDSGLRDEYVSPMFEVTWGPALAAFSTAMESANGTIGSLISIASDEELELAAENAAETIEVCLTGFRFAICTAGLCGNDTARDAFMFALSRFSQLGTGCLLEARHVRCIQTMLSLARDDGELLGSSWEHVFRALSEINRFHQLFHLMARNDRAAAAAAERRRRRLSEKERKRKEKEKRKAAAEDGESIGDPTEEDIFSEAEDSLAESDLFSDDDDLLLEEDMDSKAIDEANARVVYDAVSESVIEAIYERSSSLSAQTVKDFVTHLCIVSRNEISVGGDQRRDLNAVTYRQQHALLSSGSNGTGADQFHHSQPNIYNLQKLVEVTHYNMESRPRLIFAELWTIVSDHLTATALHSNPAIAMYAVDSFRQLSIQYLQRDELEVFEFQRRFLKPLEVVMARSVHVSTKELLLDCVGRIIHVFSTDGASPEKAARKGGLKSGWVPILSILGLGGRDENSEIAKTSFRILSGEVNRCVSSTVQPTVLLSEHFVETLDALMMQIKGPHETISLQALQQVSRLADYLADDAVAPPQLRRKATATLPSGDVDTKQELELWWPLLLCLSQTVGDIRLDVRSKGLETLMSIIISYFFPPVDESVHIKRTKLNDDVQNLQLIFRGILFPILEFADFGAQDGPTPPVPSDFERFLSHSKQRDERYARVSSPVSWLETTFDPFMDACITICLRSASAFKDDALIDEIFALLNACLLSDSGLLAVRGLQRLEQFITSDLRSDALTDDCWATVSHMLRRCLSVRNLPRARSSKHDDSDEDDVPDYEQAVREFIAEESILSERRYIGSNATMVIGLLLSSDRFTIGFRWRLFLIAGLAHAIVEWEHAAEILKRFKMDVDDRSPIPPYYYETSVYGRKWMNRFLLQLASMKEVVQAPSDADLKANRFAAAQKLVMDETQRLLAAFLHREKAASHYRHTERDEALHIRFTALVTELLSGYNNMDLEHLKDMVWINSVLLGGCIQSKNEQIRLSVKKLVQRTSKSTSAAPSPYPPSPVKPSPATDSASVATKDRRQTPTDDGKHSKSAVVVTDSLQVANASLEIHSAPSDELTVSAPKTAALEFATSSSPTTSAGHEGLPVKTESTSPETAEGKVADNESSASPTTAVAADARVVD